MRIVAGELRGRTIAAPEGSNTRPTTDRVREALFSSLYSLRGGFEDAVVLDTFAGSGALGLEAISRGARCAVFFERDSKTAAILKKNISSCKLDSGRYSVVQRDSMTAPMPQGYTFDLVFLDPPYKDAPGDILEMVARRLREGSISADAIIVYEHAAASKDAVAHEADRIGFDVLSAKKYGKTVVTTMSCANYVASEVQEA